MKKKKKEHEKYLTSVNSASISGGDTLADCHGRSIESTLRGGGGGRGGGGTSLPLRQGKWVQGGKVGGGETGKEREKGGQMDFEWRNT